MIEHFRNTAITVQNPISIAMNGDVSIFDNIISDYRIGIHGLNIAEMGKAGVYFVKAILISGDIITSKFVLQ